MYTESREAYQLIYESDIEIRFVSMAARTMIVDRFGDELEITGFRSRMSRMIGEAINWDAADQLAFNELWTGAVLNDSLR